MVFCAVQTICKAIVILLVGFDSDQVVGLESKGNDLSDGEGGNSSESREHNGSSAHDHFGYNRVDGPSQWARVFHDCGGLRQSPISLDTSTALTTHQPHMRWWGYSLNPASMILVNNGHTVVLKGIWDHDFNPFNWDTSNMDDMYVFDHLHFHWGPDDASGSEHTLNNEKFPLEMHAVHYRKELGSVSAAAHVLGGIKVVAVLFRISEHNNSALNDILDGLDHVHKGNATANVSPFKLSHLVPDFSKQFLQYNGSLTTPPCSESVTWVIYGRASVVSQQQVEHFRHFSDDEAGIITHNHRPVQPLNGRTVLHVV